MAIEELKCCKLCGAFYTCDHKGECCPECQYFDPVETICLAGPRKNKAKKADDDKIQSSSAEVDPETFLFEDDDDDFDDVLDDDDDDDDDFDEDDDFDDDEFYEDDWD